MAEINNEYGNSEIVNYQVSGTTKRLYHASKEPKEGYAKIELESGKLTYHRYLDGLIGKLSYINFKESEFGKKFGIMLRDSSETSSISVALDKAPYRALIEGLFNVDFDKEIAIKFYPKKQADKVYQNCFVYYTQEKYEEAGKTKNKTPERLDTAERPKANQIKSGKRAGEWDFNEQEEWYYDKVNELVSRFEKWKLSKSTTSVKAESSKEAVPSNLPQKGFVESNDDDLGF